MPGKLCRLNLNCALRNISFLALVQIAAVAVEVGGVHFHHQIDATSAGEEGLLHFAVAWEADHVVAEEVVPAPENVAAEVVQLHCVEAWKGDHAVA